MSEIDGTSEEKEELRTKEILWYSFRRVTENPLSNVKLRIQQTC